MKLGDNYVILFLFLSRFADKGGDDSVVVVFTQRGCYHGNGI